MKLWSLKKCSKSWVLSLFRESVQRPYSLVVYRFVVTYRLSSIAYQHGFRNLSSIVYRLSPVLSSIVYRLSAILSSIAHRLSPILSSTVYRLSPNLSSIVYRLSPDWPNSSCIVYCLWSFLLDIALLTVYWILQVFLRVYSMSFLESKNSTFHNTSKWL